MMVQLFDPKGPTLLYQIRSARSTLSTSSRPNDLPNMCVCGAGV